MLSTFSQFVTSTQVQGGYEAYKDLSNGMIFPFFFKKDETICREIVMMMSS